MVENQKKMVLSLCICSGCPSYKDCSKAGGKKELGFCFKTPSKSSCINQERGCMCGACPAKQKFSLKNFYFCIEGNEEQQNKKKK